MLTETPWIPSKGEKLHGTLLESLKNKNMEYDLRRQKPHVARAVPQIPKRNCEPCGPTRELCALHPTTRNPPLGPHTLQEGVGPSEVTRGPQESCARVAPGLRTLLGRARVAHPPRSRAPLEGHRTPSKRVARPFWRACDPLF